MAKKFSFRLEPVLNLRTHKVNEAKEVFLQIQAKRIKKDNEIQSAIDDLNSLYTGKSGTIPVTELQANYYRQDFLKHEIVKMNAERDRLLEIENHRRNLLAEAMKEEKILLKLKEKKREYYLEELKQEDNKFMDEIANNRFNSSKINNNSVSIGN